MADSVKQTKRQLTIKQGVVRRLAKEVKTYKLEYEQQGVAVTKMAETVDADEWEMKNARKVEKDCEQMIAPAQQRLDDAYQVLKDMLEATQSDDEINSTDEFSSAKKVYDEVTAELTTQ